MAGRPSHMIFLYLLNHKIISNHSHKFRDKLNSKYLCACINLKKKHHCLCVLRPPFSGEMAGEPERSNYPTVAAEKAC